MRTTDFVNSYFDAWNQQDPEGVAEHLAGCGIYRDVSENRQRTRDELQVSLRKFFRHYRFRYELIGEILDSGNTLAFQYRMLPPGDDDTSSEVRGAEFVTMDGDTAIHIVDYYDMTVAQRAPKYAKSGLDDGRLTQYRNRLRRLMRDEQLYLDAELTLPFLAEQVGCSINHLSQVINAGFGVSFFDYLNRHRIEHARQLLALPGETSGAILEVAYTVGFNSNSAFYTAFKKFVGLTPAQYREQALSGKL